MPDNTTNNEDKTESVKDLADAISIQVKTANRSWYIVMTIALLVLFPPAKVAQSDVGIQLPLQLGTVDAVSFYPVVFAVFSVLIVAFAAAHAQSYRAVKLAQMAIEKHNNELSMGIDRRDLFDMLRIPSVNRVAPLSQLLRGKYQFWFQANNTPCWRQIVSGFYYIVLKVVAAVVYWALPGYSYWIAYTQAQAHGASLWYANPLLAIGMSSLLVVAISDLQYVFNTSKILFGANTSVPSTVSSPDAK